MYVADTPDASEPNAIEVDAGALSELERLYGMHLRFHTVMNTTSVEMILPCTSTSLQSCSYSAL